MLERKAKTRAGRLIVRAAASLVVAYLVYFHALLFWQRVLNDSLFKPAVALRWLATAVLLVVLLKLLRAGVPLVGGRRAVGFWLVVLLLHGSLWGPLSGDTPVGGAELPAEIFLSLPAVLVAAAIVWLVSSRRRGAGRQADGSLLRLLASRVVPIESYALRAGALPSLACRPPPTI